MIINDLFFKNFFLQKRNLPVKSTIFVLLFWSLTK
jgi:hypothetical protein